MNFFKKIFKFSSETSKDEKVKEQQVILSLDDAFVHHFIKKGGKFLYCTKKKEVINHLQKIVEENNWEELVCVDKELSTYIKNIEVIVKSDLNHSAPFLTSCEHLISDNGDILFSSNQLKSNKISSLSDHFIVYATTSQLVKNTGQGLTGIKTNFKKNIPTNISSVKNYTINNSEENFLNYGSSNSKNLYLLLFENL